MVRVPIPDLNVMLNVSVVYRDHITETGENGSALTFPPVDWVCNVILFQLVNMSWEGCLICIWVLEGSFMGSQSCFEGSTCQTCICFVFLVSQCNCSFIDNVFRQLFWREGFGNVHLFPVDWVCNVLFLLQLVNMSWEGCLICIWFLEWSFMGSQFCFVPGQL